MRRLVLLLLLLLAAPARAPRPDPRQLQGLARGKVETCGGWRLNRMKEVKAFVTEDIPLYHNLVMKHLPGADPELVLLNIRYEELERIPLSDMTREEINQMVQELGFYRKESQDAPVPEEFQLAPAKPPLPLQTKEENSEVSPSEASAAKNESPTEPNNQEHPDL